MFIAFLIRFTYTDDDLCRQLEVLLGEAQASIFYLHSTVLFIPLACFTLNLLHMQRFGLIFLLSLMLNRIMLSCC